MVSLVSKKFEGLRIKREIRDPVYNYVYVTDYEDKVLNSDIFQRLNRIYQMQTVHQVYNGAKYPRKEHSLGVMHLAHKAILNILYLQCKDIRENISPLLYGRLLTLDKEDEEKFEKLDLN